MTAVSKSENAVADANRVRSPYSLATKKPELRSSKLLGLLLQKTPKPPNSKQLTPRICICKLPRAPA